MAFTIGKNCQIDPSVHIDVKEGFIGDGAIILAGARIEGTRVEIGREAYIDRGATIGGGSCFDPDAFLSAGDWLHMGVNAQINTARGVTAGHECGVGIETKIFTHGAYIDSYNLGAPVQWAPVKIGNNVWLPNAWVNPGVQIGDNVVVAARSLVNINLPKGCLAGGTPAKVIKENYFPRTLGLDEKSALIKSIIVDAWKCYLGKSEVSEAPIHYQQDVIEIRTSEGNTFFDLKNKTISGAATPLSQTFKNQLRRNGIRFRFEVANKEWKAW